MQPIKPGIYRHFKGKDYRVIGMARDASSEKDQVLYTPCYECAFKYFTRPVEEWSQLVKDASGNTVQRFTFLREVSSEETI